MEDNKLKQVEQAAADIRRIVTVLAGLVLRLAGAVEVLRNDLDDRTARADLLRPTERVPIRPRKPAGG